MPPLASLRSAARTTTLARPTLYFPLVIRTRTFSSSQAKKAASGSHESKYDPPTGWLFGVKPGEKYQKEGWETLTYWGVYGGFALAIIAYTFKPDTSIQTWALEEARRRLEAEGILADPTEPKKNQ
ncbi:uncharacterized protein BDR25DRAFT_256718 [Lindgomyces ingoldianus]|uniref:Uncharacterized protein n=1 Tax=Lindgomyces ingoldianus TaxID=673940 RepID=A0ACB6R3H6_9PLEO|nr:uncharacterized protein BDR25DRAFT_256718 [Lindgomyces ingoldianus]KAF2473818.1 hypothetical protein BDR25DRAFT_256718 [Lindgomyces ingoldianus]